MLFLVEHLLVNSQIGLLLGDKGKGFISAVNTIHNLPYLPVIEIFLLGSPILLHLILGIRYLFTSKLNAHKTDGSTPSLKEYGRNRAYSWQRITSWILLFGLIGHIVNFRFLEYPLSVNEGGSPSYFVQIRSDNKLYMLADRLHISLYDSAAIDKEKIGWEKEQTAKEALVNAAYNFAHGPQENQYDPGQTVIAHSANTFIDKGLWIKALCSYQLKPGDLVASCNDFGTATLLSVRDAFKSPLYVGLYTLFLLAACFHAANGFWTFLISWGIVLKFAAQKRMGLVALVIMALLAGLGLTSIWGPYLSTFFY